MATSSTRLMTFAEFEKLPDPPGGHYELHHGEAVFVATPKHGHHSVQRRLLRLLERAAGNAAEVSMEMGYRPRGENEYWVADVMVLSKPRWEAIPRNGILSGSPDLVIEVLFPSNTAKEMREKKKLCLETGSREFWVVDIEQNEIEVSTSDGRFTTYTAGQSIPLFCGGEVAVDEIFS